MVRSGPIPSDLINGSTSQELIHAIRPYLWLTCLIFCASHNCKREERGGGERVQGLKVQRATLEYSRSSSPPDPLIDHTPTLHVSIT